MVPSVFVMPRLVFVPAPGWMRQYPNEVTHYADGKTADPSIASNRFWQDVEQHWISCQTPLGTWDYQTGGSTNYAMTMAGITALSVCRDYMSDAATQTSSPSWLCCSGK